MRHTHRFRFVAAAHHSPPRDGLMRLLQSEPGWVPRIIDFRVYRQKTVVHRARAPVVANARGEYAGSTSGARLPGGR